MKTFNCVQWVRGSDKLVSICAWCPDKAEADAHFENLNYDITHGICAACTAKETAPFKGPVESTETTRPLKLETKEQIEAFLNGEPIP